MIRRSRILIALAIGVLLFGFTVRPTMAASDALDQTIQTPLAIFGGNGINGQINIPTLTAGSTVSGSGTMTIVVQGTTVYSGDFTATTLNSISTWVPTGPSFQPLPTTVTTYMPPISTIGLGLITTSAASPTPTPNFGVALQLTATSGTTPTVSPNQNLILVCGDAKAVLDIGITLSSSVSSTAAALLAAQNTPMLLSFSDLTGTSFASLC
jgi:hypothetical protein